MNDEIESPGRPLDVPPHQDRQRSVGLLILVVVLVIFTAVLVFARTRSRSSDSRSGALSALVMGDMQLKLSYFYDNLGDDDASASALTSARRVYENSTRDAATPAGLRRLGVIQGMRNPRRALDTLQLMVSADSLRGVSDTDRARIRREVEMWRHVYSTRPVRQVDVRRYAQRIGELNIGPARHYALSHLYVRASMPRLAREQQQRASKMFTRDIWVVSALLVLLALAAAMGTLILLLMSLSPDRYSRLLALDERHAEEEAISSALWLGFSVYILIFLGGSMIVGVLLSVLLGSAPTSDRQSLVVQAQIAGSLMVNLVALLVVRRILREAGADLRSVGLGAKNVLAEIGWGIAGYAVALPLLGMAMLAAYAVQRLLPGVPTPTNPAVSMIMNATTPSVLLAIFVLAAVAAPFFEEFFFRGVLFRAFRSRYGVWPGILATSGIFALIHPQLPAGFIPIFTLGFTFALIAQARNSLLPCMVAHGINNGGLFLLIHFATRS